MREKLVIGNWKMHGTQAQAHELATHARELAAALPNIEIGIAPSFVHLPACLAIATGSDLIVAAQNLAAYGNGAHTGEVSAEMLTDLGVGHVLVGHSERRQRFGEDDAVVATKLEMALEAGLHPVLCLGETLQQREAGATADVVLQQLMAVRERVGVEGLRRTSIAYEPVWAIGTGLTATPEQAQEVHVLIRSAISQHDAIVGGLIRILYGGSVKGSNARQLLAQTDIDGALVGGAALIPEDFAAICHAASQDG